MRKWINFFKKFAIEGFGNFTWLINNSTTFPYTYSPKSFLEDQLNLYSDYNKAALKLKESKNDN